MASLILLQLEQQLEPHLQQQVILIQEQQFQQQEQVIIGLILLQLILDLIHFIILSLFPLIYSLLELKLVVPQLLELISKAKVKVL